MGIKKKKNASGTIIFSSKINGFSIFDRADPHVYPKIPMPTHASTILPTVSESSGCATTLIAVDME